MGRVRRGSAGRITTLAVRFHAHLKVPQLSIKYRDMSLRFVPLTACLHACVRVLYNHTAGGCNYTVILDGWFGDLADLRQEDPAIASYLLDWISTMVRRRSTKLTRLRQHRARLDQHIASSVST